jgi:hypothetical protein
VRTKRKKTRRAQIVNPPTRWESREACLVALRQAAWLEAKRTTTWPAILRVGLGLQPPGDVRRNERTDALLEEVRKLGKELVASLKRFHTLIEELDGPEDSRPATQAIEEAASVIDLRASFARGELYGKYTLNSGGRPPVPARSRVAKEYARGWTNLGDGDGSGKVWKPSARDLALLSICEGADELPAKWKTMTIASLIDAEERAMRPYLRTGKK